METKQYIRVNDDRSTSIMVEITPHIYINSEFSCIDHRGGVASKVSLRWYPPGDALPPPGRMVWNGRIDGRRKIFRRTMQELYRYPENDAYKIKHVIEHVVFGTATIQNVAHISKYRNRTYASNEMMDYLRNGLTLMADWYGVETYEKRSPAEGMFEEIQTESYAERSGENNGHVYKQARRANPSKPWPQDWHDWPGGRAHRYWEEKENSDWKRETQRRLAEVTAQMEASGTKLRELPLIYRRESNIPSPACLDDVGAAPAGFFCLPACRAKYRRTDDEDD
jgi:hypothetical protein